MRKIDTASYSAQKPGRVKPERVDLGTLPPLAKPKDKKPAEQKPEQPSNRDTTTPRNHDTTVSRYHDTIIERVRKAVKDFGKEAATHRFTVEEKKAIADIIYSYKNRGIRTSENEIARIAVNFIVEDYRENGENSVLDKALKALNE
jgi:hypothetical protein